MFCFSYFLEGYIRFRWRHSPFGIYHVVGLAVRLEEHDYANNSGENKMKVAFTVLAASLILAGCQAAVVSSAKWDSGLTVNSGSNIETRCQEVDLRDNDAMARLFPKYDGWKMVYVSEYTTGNKIGTSSAVCFERLKK
jgi:hypothetical protein